MQSGRADSAQIDRFSTVERDAHGAKSLGGKAAGRTEDLPGRVESLGQRQRGAKARRRQPRMAGSESNAVPIGVHDSRGRAIVGIVRRSGGELIAACSVPAFRRTGSGCSRPLEVIEQAQRIDRTSP